MGGASCSKCGRAVPGGRPTCMYCGAYLEATVPCVTCKRPLLQSAPKCSFCGTPTGRVRAAEPRAADLSRARVELFQTAERLRVRQAFGDALKLYQDVIRVDPSHARALLGAARCLANLGLVEDAIVTLDQAVGQNPDLAEARGLRETLIQSRRSLPAGFVEAGAKQMVERALTFVAARQFDRALVAFDGLLSGLPPAALLMAHNAPIHTYRAICLKHLARLSEALAATEHAVRADPGYAPGWARRGDVLDDLGRLDESVAAFDQAVQLDPNRADVWVDRGYVLRKCGRPADAESSYQRALAIDPRHVIALHNRGAVLLELGRVDDAVGLFEQALAIDPEHEPSRSALDRTARRGSRWTAVAESFATTFSAAYGVELDFTPASLRTLDVVLDVLFEPPEAEPGRDWRPSAGKRTTIGHLGAYLGEVFRRSCRGTWREAGDHSTVVAGTSVLTPFAVAFERLRTGEGALSSCYADAARGAGFDPAGPDPADWTRHVPAVVERRYLEEALGFAETAIAIDPRHELGHFWKGIIEYELGRDGRAALESFVALARGHPELASQVEGARRQIARKGPKLPPGRPGPPMIAALADGGAAEEFVYRAAPALLSPKRVVVVSFRVDIPVSEARELRVLPLVPAGVLAHAISIDLEAAVGCFEPDAAEVDAALDPLAIRAWTAVVLGRRCSRVSFVGNRPWSARVVREVESANAILRGRGLSDGLRLDTAPAEIDAILADFVRGS